MSESPETKEEKMGYAIGLDVGNTIKNLPFKVSLGHLFDAVEDIIGGDQPRISRNDFKTLMGEFHDAVKKSGEKMMSDLAGKNREAAAKFMAENAAREGVMVTGSGLQYTVLTEGDGECPAVTDTVTVHYVGSLIDGTVFDSSIQRGEPASFALNAVIPGWSEGVSLMKPGAKHRLYLPPELAYGDQGVAGVIDPASALIFDVELISVG